MSSSIFIYDNQSIQKILSNTYLQKFILSHSLHESKRLEEEGINHSLLEIIPNTSTSEAELTSKIHASLGVIKVLPSNHVRSILINDIKKSFSIDEVYFSILKLGVKEETFQRLFLFDDPTQAGLNLGYALIEFDTNSSARKSISLLANGHSGVSLHCNDVDYFLDQFVKVVSLSYISTSEKFKENEENHENLSSMINNERFIFKIKSEFENFLGNKTISKIRIYSDSIIVIFNKTFTITMINSVVSRIKIGNFKVKAHPFRVPSQNPSNKYKEKRSLNLNLLVKEDSQMIFSLLNQNLNKKEIFEKYENEYYAYVNRKNKERKEEDERRESVLKNKRVIILNEKEKEKEKEKNYRKDKSYKTEDNDKYDKYERNERSERNENKKRETEKNENEKEKNKQKQTRDENKQKQIKTELSSTNIDKNTINLLSAFIKNNDKTVFSQILPSIIALLSSIKNCESSKLSNQIQLIVALYNTKVLSNNQDLANSLIQQLIDFAVQPSCSLKNEELSYSGHGHGGSNSYMTEYQGLPVGSLGTGGNPAYVNNNNGSNSGNFIKNQNQNQNQNQNLTFPIYDNNLYSYYPNNILQNNNTNQVDINSYQKPSNYLNNIDSNYLFNPTNQPVGFNFHTQNYPSNLSQSTNSFMNFPHLLNKNQTQEIEQGQIIDPNFLLLQYQNFPYGNMLNGNPASIGSNPNINSTNQNMSYGYK